MSVYHIIILDNKKCQILSDDEATIKRLRNYLSFKLAGVEYTPAYQNGWSGITYLLSKANKFDIGLLEKVKGFLTKNNVTFTLEDKRPPKILNASLDISEKLKENNLIPREHQERIAALTDTHDRGIVRAVTASGKTLAIAMMTAKLNKPTIVCVIGLDLLDQFHKLFSKLFDEEIGYVGNGVCDIQRISICSVWTLGRSLKLESNIVDEESDSNEKEIEPSNYEKILSFLKGVKIFFLDESHSVVAQTMIEIYKAIDPEYIYGFSGTPFRDDNSDLLINSILGEQIIDISASELIEKGLIATPIIKFVSVPKMHLSNNGKYLSVYKEYIVENEVRNNLIVQHTQELLDKKYTPLVLYRQIKHGKILYEKMLSAGIKCRMLQGSDSLTRRNEVKKMLEEKEIDVILASVIFDIGIDLPMLSGLVLSGSGKSCTKVLQRVGRILRIIENKKYSAVIDFYDQVKFLKSHSLARYKVYSSEKGFKVFKSKEMK